MGISSATKTTKKAAFCLLFLGLLEASQDSHRAWAIPPAAAGFLNVVPGLGHTLDGKPLVGLGYLSALVALIVGANNTQGPAKVLLGGATPSLYCYQIYAAYRDGEPGNRMIGNSNVLEDYIAAFNPMNALDFKVAAFDAIGAAQGIWSPQPNGTYNLTNLLYYGIAVQQEEALYRGFLYPVFTDLLGGSKLAAAMVTSLLDSAQHALYLSNALDPFIFSMRTALFLYLTWMYEQNQYQLTKNIFAHAWFDYLVRPPLVTDAQATSGGQPLNLNQGAFVGGVKIHF